MPSIRPLLLALLLCAPGAHAQGASSFRVDEAAPARVAPAEAPLSLTASDGTGLALVRLDARAVVEGPLAFTELRLAFKNPRPRVIEGRFRVTLPEGAALSRFAMKIGDRWQEGEVVEKEAARRAYEDFLHRRQDPALLEQGAGNEFTARVFPIPASGVKELIVSYSHALTATGGRYELPLRGLPEIERVSIRVAGQPKRTLTRRGWVPDRDFVVTPPAARARALRAGAFTVAEVVPIADAAEERVRSLTVLLDTSASRALALPGDVKLLERLARALARGQGAKTPLKVATFDQTVEVVYDGAAGGYGREVSRRVLRRRALGASDVGRALSWAARNAGTERLVLLTDGVATAGAIETSDLDGALTAVANSPIQRVDAVATGGLRDTELLRAIVTGHARKDGAVIDGDLPLRDVTARLVRAVRSGLRVEVPGAQWVWPETLDSVQAGDSVLLFAALPRKKALTVKVDGRVVRTGKPARANRHLLGRAAAQAEIARLVAKRSAATSAKDKQRLKEKVVALSVESRVMSPFTSLLVLESEADYARYGIARRGLADVLVVTDGGLIAQKRSMKDIPRPKPKPKPSFRGKAKKKSAANRAREGESEPPSLDGAPPPGQPPAEAPAEAARDRSAGDVGGEEARVAESSVPEPAPSAEPPPAPRRAARPDRRRTERSAIVADEESEADDDDAEEKPRKPDADPYEGPFGDVMRLLEKRQARRALQRATAWRDEAPGDVMALIALGEAFTAAGRHADAARAYGSLIDLFPARADLRRFAGERLEALATVWPAALELATDTYEKARDQRPDHPASHHLLAFALVKGGDPARAFGVLVEGLKRRYPEGRFRGVTRILRDDLGLVAAAWKRAAPKRRADIDRRLRAAGGNPEQAPSLRFILNWETDANDVDFHIYDAKGGHAYYSKPRLPSGGELYADVTTGYGPECFTIRNNKRARSAPYTLQAHYYSRGPMGYGMGKLQIIEHDGAGRLTFEERPFVVMKDGAYLDLGQVK